MDNLKKRKPRGKSGTSHSSPQGSRHSTRDWNSYLGFLLPSHQKKDFDPRASIVVSYSKSFK